MGAAVCAGRRIFVRRDVCVTRRQGLTSTPTLSKCGSGWWHHISDDLTILNLSSQLAHRFSRRARAKAQREDAPWKHDLALDLGFEVGDASLQKIGQGYEADEPGRGSSGTAITLAAAGGGAPVDDGETSDAVLRHAINHDTQRLIGIGVDDWGLAGDDFAEAAMVASMRDHL